MADLSYCARNGIQWVRRLTGGRGVVHDQELTYADVSNDTQLFPVGDISGTYHRISDLITDAMRNLARRELCSEGDNWLSKARAP